MTTPTPRSVLAFLTLAFAVCACNTTQPAHDIQEPTEEAMFIQYLEVVTPDVNATCDALERLHGVSFGEPDVGLGNARTAALKGGGKIGVRAPMREDEHPVVRPYLLVEDIEAAVKAAQAAGAQVALPPMEIPGGGKFAIYIQGGIEHGLWMF